MMTTPIIASFCTLYHRGHAEARIRKVRLGQLGYLDYIRFFGLFGLLKCIKHKPTRSKRSIKVNT